MPQGERHACQEQIEQGQRADPQYEEEEISAHVGMDVRVTVRLILPWSFESDLNSPHRHTIPIAWRALFDGNTVEQRSIGTAEILHYVASLCRQHKLCVITGDT